VNDSDNTAHAIEQMARLADIDLSPERAAVAAAAIGRLAGAANLAARSIPFEADPTGFLAGLSSGASK